MLRPKTVASEEDKSNTVIGEDEIPQLGVWQSRGAKTRVFMVIFTLGSALTTRAGQEGEGNKS